jgi:hypothetical protein
VYGATVVLVDDRGVQQTYRGHALIHLYPTNHPRTVTFPRPPPRDNCIAARQLLSQPVPPVEVRGVGGPRDPRFTNLEEFIPSMANHRFDPRVPELATRTPRYGETFANDPNRKVEVVDEAGRELSAAETLVRIRDLRQEVNSPGANVPDVRVTDPSTPVSGAVRMSIANLVHETNIPLGTGHPTTEIAIVSGDHFPRTRESSRFQDQTPDIQRAETFRAPHTGDKPPCTEPVYA